MDPPWIHCLVNISTACDRLTGMWLSHHAAVRGPLVSRVAPSWVCMLAHWRPPLAPHPTLSDDRSPRCRRGGVPTLLLSYGRPCAIRVSTVSNLMGLLLPQSPEVHRRVHSFQFKGV